MAEKSWWSASATDPCGPWYHAAGCPLCSGCSRSPVAALVTLTDAKQSLGQGRDGGANVCCSRYSGPRLRGMVHSAPVTAYLPLELSVRSHTGPRNFPKATHTSDPEADGGMRLILPLARD